MYTYIYHILSPCSQKPVTYHPDHISGKKYFLVWSQIQSYDRCCVNYSLSSRNFENCRTYRE